MNISYWDCPFRDYDETYDDRIYGCTNPLNERHWCGLENKWGREKAICRFLEKGRWMWVDVGVDVTYPLENPNPNAFTLAWVPDEEVQTHDF